MSRRKKAALRAIRRKQVIRPKTNRHNHWHGTGKTAVR